MKKKFALSLALLGIVSIQAQQTPTVNEFEEIEKDWVKVEKLTIDDQIGQLIGSIKKGLKNDAVDAIVMELGNALVKKAPQFTQFKSVQQDLKNAIKELFANVGAGTGKIMSYDDLDKKIDYIADNARGDRKALLNKEYEELKTNYTKSKKARLINHYKTAAILLLTNVLGKQLGKPALLTDLEARFAKAKK